MSSLTPEDIVLYKQLYTVLNEPIVAEAFAKYAKIRYDIAIRGLRSKSDTYNHGFHNGEANAWEEVLNLKDYLIKILRNT